MSISRRLVATAVPTAAFAFPIGVLASHGFTFVDAVVHNDAYTYGAECGTTIFGNTVAIYGVRVFYEFEGVPVE